MFLLATMEMIVHEGKQAAVGCPMSPSCLAPRNEHCRKHTLGESVCKPRGTGSGQKNVHWEQQDEEMVLCAFQREVTISCCFVLF